MNNKQCDCQQLLTDRVIWPFIQTTVICFPIFPFSVGLFVMLLISEHNSSKRGIHPKRSQGRLLWIRDFANRRMQLISGQKWGERRSPSLWKDLWPRTTSDPEDRRLWFGLGSYICFVCVLCEGLCTSVAGPRVRAMSARAPHVADKIDWLMSERHGAWALRRYESAQLAR